ncbi:CpXC domain-containing protein [uncultured Desulfosarcina sp.]|uniref:CpXC domain-containing protein n=1 Tax=uncultured Desulfosarcina sp. TaxID=218289 RepID=UPI0029C79903|nr:CpXC domain-containing protein [uncultured Desulfosarcina sp.]
MTTIETENIECPSCKVEQHVDVYQAINAMENSELVQWLFNGDINIFKCNECGHEAHIQLPLLFNDYRVGVKIQYFPEQWLADNSEGVCNDYLGMLAKMGKFRDDFQSNKLEDLLVVFSMDVTISQIKFRTQFFDMANSGMND